MPKTLTPEDIAIHITDIFNFAKEGKTYAEIQKHNWRFRSIKNILIKKQILTTHWKRNSKKTYFKSNFLKLQSQILFEILQEFQNDIKKQNEKLVDNFIKKDRTKELAPVYNNENTSTAEKLNELEEGLLKFKEQSIEIKKAMDELSKINDSLENENKKLLFEKEELESRYKKQVEEHAKRFDELVARNNLNVTEYSNFINEKLVEIADLKNKLLKENKIVCYKIFGITIFKVTTNKRN
jgi:hypothetical protein